MPPLPPSPPTPAEKVSLANAVMPSAVLFGRTPLMAHLIEYERWMASIATVGVSGGVETVLPNDLRNGEYVIIAGCPHPSVNGVWSCYSIDETHFVLDGLTLNEPVSGGYFLPQRTYTMSEIPAAARITTPVALNEMSFEGGVFDAGNLAFRAVPEGRRVSGIVVVASGREAEAEIALLYTNVFGLPLVSNGLPLGVYWSDSPDRIFSSRGVMGAYVHQDKPSSATGYTETYYGPRARKPAVIKANGKVIEDALEIKVFPDGWGYVVTLSNPATGGIDKLEDGQIQTHQVWGYLEIQN